MHVCRMLNWSDSDQRPDQKCHSHNTDQSVFRSRLIDQFDPTIIAIRR
ncbi:16718_t:CDS:2 [Dentiscutata erythropus]|uniref:16718_t:CDS:1 n=1 Tax=Dentiscutata erythropus TaxID=1348616 RepID=A0A9N9DBF9_9GLOM|nr:16718_t:CDS:2 [Dentiscutata erythropus]